MTLPYLEVSFKNIFEYGQAYVSISRATDLNGLKLLHYNRNKVRVYGIVKQFYKALGYDCNSNNSSSNSDSNSNNNNSDGETDKNL